VTSAVTCARIALIKTMIKDCKLGNALRYYVVSIGTVLDCFHTYVELFNQLQSLFSATRRWRFLRITFRWFK
jgi:hypothetical protein